MKTEQSLSACVAAHASWAATGDRTARTAPGRAALWAKFELQADPDGQLSPQDRAARAASLRKAHFARLALRSAASRRRAKELLAEAARSDEELAALAELEDLTRRLTDLGL